MAPYLGTDKMHIAPVALSLMLVVSLAASSVALTARTEPTNSPVLGPIFDALSPPTDASFVSQVPANSVIDLTVDLQYRNLENLELLLAGVLDPASPDYRHFLTLSEFNDEFEPSPSTVYGVESYFLSHGAISVESSGGGLIMNVAIRESSLERVFGAPLAYYSQGGTPFYSVARTPSLPAAFQGIVASVDGLTNQPNGYFHTDSREVGRIAATRVVAGPADYDVIQGSSPSEDVFYGTDYQAIFDDLPLLRSGFNGSGYAIATIMSSGFNATESASLGQNLPPFDPAAVAAYFSASFPVGVAPPTVVGVPVTIDNSTPPQPGPAPAVDGGDDSGAVAENSLDLEMAGSMAPGAALYNFYFSGSLISDSLSDAAGDFDTALGTALNESYGPDKLAAISNSWGLLDENDTGWDELEMKAAGLGVTLIAASGDQGDGPITVQNHPQEQWPGFPATAAFDDWGTLAVGGAEMAAIGTPIATWDPTSGSLPTAGYDAINITGSSGWTAWYVPSSNVNDFAGTEGGVSDFINEPKWQADSAAQSAITYSAKEECGLGPARGVPDVAMSGFNTVVFITEQTVGGQEEVGGGIFDGTSIASPLMAGLVAVVAETDGGPLGYMDPEIYSIASYFTAHPNGAADPFSSIDNGSNYVFNASKGWDALTGWGAPDAELLAGALGNSTLASYVFNQDGVPGKASGSVASCGSSGSSPGSALPLEIFVILLIASAFAVLVVVSLSTRKRPAPVPPPTHQADGTQAPPGHASQMVICGQCHRAFPTQWGFCPYCGTWIQRGPP